MVTTRTRAGVNLVMLENIASVNRSLAKMVALMTGTHVAVIVQVWSLVVSAFACNSR